MGRGLSELQKNVLRLAYWNRQNGKARGDRDIYPHHIMGDLYGFSEHTVRCRGYDRLSKDTRPRKDWWATLRDQAWGQKFDREEIGLAVHNAARAATGKTLRRLEKRGLLSPASYGQAYCLTDAGLKLAEALPAMVITR